MIDTTPDYAELIEQLRSHEERWECAGGGGWETPEVCIQAAAALEAQAAELAAVKEMYAREGAKALYELERAEAAEARVKELEKLCNDTEAQLQDYAQRLAEADRVIEQAIQEAVADDYDDWFRAARAYLDKKEKSHD